MQMFGIGSNRLSNFIKKGILTRRKPGGLNGKEVTKDMKKDLCDYINGLRMEEVSSNSSKAGPTTFLRLIDEISYATLHEHYKEHYKLKDPNCRVIEKYKTFYEHFHRLFPDVQLNKAPRTTNKKQTTNKRFSHLELELVD